MSFKSGVKDQGAIDGKSEGGDEVMWAGWDREPGGENRITGWGRRLWHQWPPIPMRMDVGKARLWHLDCIRDVLLHDCQKLGVVAEIFRWRAPKFLRGVFLKVHWIYSLSTNRTWSAFVYSLVETRRSFANQTYCLSAQLAFKYHK